MATPEQELQPEQQSNRAGLAALLLLLGTTRARLLRSGIQFVWDASRGRYWSLSTQSIVAPNTIRAWVDAAIQTSEGRITFLTRRLNNGTITYPAWATQVQGELKAMHTGLAHIAIGGEWSSTPAGRLGARLRMLYEKLNGLGLEWEQGLVSPAQMLARMGMAVQAGRGTYEGMFRGMMLDTGMTEEMRVLGAAAHCADCPPISGFWTSIGSLPGIGDSACLSRCACSFDYRRGPTTSLVWG